jgi:hypothetical protein
MVRRDWRLVVSTVVVVVAAVVAATMVADHNAIRADSIEYCGSVPDLPKSC